MTIESALRKSNEVWNQRRDTADMIQELEHTRMSDLTVGQAMDAMEAIRVLRLELYLLDCEYNRLSKEHSQG